MGFRCDVFNLAQGGARYSDGPGRPYTDAKAGAPHHHGYAPNGQTKVVDPIDGNPPFPTMALKGCSEMESKNDEVVTLGNGDIVMWIDSGTLHLKCVTKQGDPVELNVNELVELLESLQKCMPHLD